MHRYPLLNSLCLSPWKFQHGVNAIEKSVLLHARLRCDATAYAPLARPQPAETGGGSPPTTPEHHSAAWAAGRGGGAGATAALIPRASGRSGARCDSGATLTIELSQTSPPGRCATGGRSLLPLGADAARARFRRRSAGSGALGVFARPPWWLWSLCAYSRQPTMAGSVRGAPSRSSL